MSHNLQKYQAVCDAYDVATMFTERSHRDSNGCLVWDLARGHNGYGTYTFTKLAVTVNTHRAMFWAIRGPIEGELVVDHLCRNRACIEPTHLRLITRELNTSLSHTARKSHCVHGHELNDATVYVFHDRKGNPHRQCRACRKRIGRARYERLRRAAL